MNLIRIMLVSIAAVSFQLCFSQEITSNEDKYLIVLDVQEYFTLNQLSDSSSSKLIESINYVISKTDPNKVIYVKTIHLVLNLSLTIPYIYVSLDTPGMRYDERLNIVNSNIFLKEESSVFTIKSLNEFLVKNKAKEIVIVGLMAEKCVYNSLIAGKELGYEMYTIPDAIIGGSQKTKDEVIDKLKLKGIKLLDINTLVIE